MTPTPELVTSADMVFVTLNYRLGPLGFMALNVKDAESQQPIRGNFGLMDQYLAMEWVKNNSRAFGADPDKVRTTPRDVISYHKLLCIAGLHVPFGTESICKLPGTCRYAIFWKLCLQHTRGTSLFFFILYVDVYLELSRPSSFRRVHPGDALPTY